MNRRNLVAGMAVLSVSTIAWTAHGRFIPRSCQACDEDRCSNPDMLYFGSLGDPDYLAACGQPHCCILATGATCADSLGCQTN